MQVISPDTLDKRRHYSGTRSKQTAILVLGEYKKKDVIKASPYAKCYSLSSLFLTLVAELKDTMASKHFPQPALLKDKYST